MNKALEEPLDPSLDRGKESFGTFFGKARPPRLEDDSLDVTDFWQTRAFGLAVALWQNGYFERETFRQELIDVIGKWDRENNPDDPDWNYWECWMVALENLLLEQDLMNSGELESELKEVLSSC